MRESSGTNLAMHIFLEENTPLPDNGVELLNSQFFQQVMGSEFLENGIKTRKKKPQKDHICKHYFLLSILLSIWKTSFFSAAQQPGTCKSKNHLLPFSCVVL